MREPTGAEWQRDALLSAPPPRTLREYRETIQRAIWCGEILEMEFRARFPKGPEWSTEPPTEAGAWEIAANETDFEPSPVTVYEFRGELWVEDDAIGRNPRDHYHGGLTRLHWRKAVAPVEADGQCSLIGAAVMGIPMTGSGPPSMPALPCSSPRSPRPAGPRLPPVPASAINPTFAGWMNPPTMTCPSDRFPIRNRTTPNPLPPHP